MEYRVFDCSFDLPRLFPAVRVLAHNVSNIFFFFLRFFPWLRFFLGVSDGTSDGSNPDSTW